MNLNLKGAIYVAIGAASYGILATFVKFANNQGIGTAGLAFSQYLFGALVLTVLSYLFREKKFDVQDQSFSKYPKMKLMVFGTFLGLTTSFYYLSIQYVPVSVGIILLMQTIWMGLVVEFFIARHLIDRYKIIGAIVALVGTVLAAKVFESHIDLDLRGIGFGLLAAASYTGVMYASSRVALELPLFTRSKYLVYGGLVVVVLFWNTDILHEFNGMVLLKWGSFLGFFGTVLPPILFNKGMPRIGTGLGSIISALEIPVSVYSAYLLLDEKVTLWQWVGIVIILISVVIINRRNL